MTMMMWLTLCRLPSAWTETPVATSRANVTVVAASTIRELGIGFPLALPSESPDRFAIDRQPFSPQVRTLTVSRGGRAILSLGDAFISVGGHHFTRHRNPCGTRLFAMCRAICRVPFCPANPCAPWLCASSVGCRVLWKRENAGGAGEERAQKGRNRGTEGLKRGWRSLAKSLISERRGWDLNPRSHEGSH